MVLAVAVPLQARTLPADASATAAVAEAPPREEEDGEIVVSAAIARDRLDVASPVSILDDTELLRAARPQIGDTIARVPGVSAATFGPNASRPVLRGLTGERVRVLTDGIGAFDVSNTSADHAVAIDPLTADRIEVVRGPAALRFGPSAVGGVVNVLDSRIPTRIPNNALAADIVAGVASAARERNVAAGVTARLTPEPRCGSEAISSRPATCALEASSSARACASKRGQAMIPMCALWQACAAASPTAMPVRRSALLACPISLVKIRSVLR